jgi:capsular exopolysaccharide synthesis family protein
MSYYDENEPEPIDLRRYVAILWRWKWLIVAAIVISALSAFFVSRLLTPIYEAKTTLLVNQAPDTQVTDYTAILTSERLAQTYAQLLTGRPVLEETLVRLGLFMDLEDLEKSINVGLIRDTQLIELKVENANPLLAANIANTLTEVFIEQNDALQANRFAASKNSLKAQLDKLEDQIKAAEAAIAALGSPLSENDKSELERLQAESTQYQASYTNLLQSYEELRLAEARVVSNVVQVEPATVPLEPVRPRVLLNTVLAAVVGGMITFGAVFLIEYLDDSIKTIHDVDRILQVPVLGYVPESKELKDVGKSLKLLEEHPLSLVAEAFRYLHTNIEFTSAPGGPKLIFVTSPGPGEGKTTIAAHLAESIAHGGKHVVLVDADLRHSSIHEVYSLPNNLGLSDMFMKDLVPQVVAHEIRNKKHLRIITSGSKVENPGELFKSIKLLKIAAQLKEQADVVIFDGPPLLVSESFVLASKLESSLLVMQPRKTREALALVLKKQLDRTQANILGVVLNRIPRGQSDPSALYLYYNYEDLVDQRDVVKRVPKDRTRNDKRMRVHRTNPIKRRQGAIKSSTSQRFQKLRNFILGPFFIILLLIIIILVSLLFDVEDPLWAKIFGFSGSVPSDSLNTTLAKMPQGCSPSFWRQPQHFESWPSLYNPDDSFETVFLGWHGEPVHTLLQALEQDGAGLPYLMQQSTAAILNAASSDLEYPYRTDEVIAMFQSVFGQEDTTEVEKVANLFEAANEASCPFP